MGLDQAAFARHVRDALDHFYEPAYLYASPLTDCLLSDPTHDAAVALRELLREAIERLRPPQSVPFGSQEWNSYRILWDRCIQRRPWHLIGQDLALGRSSVYKYMQQAVEALSAVLWQQYQMACAARERAEQPPMPPNDGSDWDQQIATEAARVTQTWPRGLVPVGTLMEDVCKLIAPLAETRQISIDYRVSDHASPLLGDVAVLHQILVDIVMAAIEHLPEGELLLSAFSQEAETLFRLGDLPQELDQTELLQQMALGQQLLASYGGRLWFDEAEQGLVIRFALPAGSRPTILVADDDPDTLLLYQRYLRGAGYALRVARNGAEIRAQLLRFQPDLIILDVLMPQEDGWMILQRLKTLPETATIPVLVYSVLAQPSLALALGAATVLRKPVRETELLSAVELALGLPDSL